MLSLLAKKKGNKLYYYRVGKSLEEEDLMMS